ncbi:MAG TPA: hypothetical protein VET65_05110 [Candidatus Limnocylindrales bacterium]|nr:hypothetical protein [Candidatus Limnocylindrales bacterium]
MTRDGLDPTQVGTAGQLRFAMLAILGSDGAIEPVPPLADDEGRDFELHLRHRFDRTIAIQVKVATAQWRPGLLYVEFARGKRRPISPWYWYFVAYLDLDRLDFQDPIFLIPSTALRRGGRVIGRAYLSLDRASHDRWTRYRVTRRALGTRLVQILEGSSALKARVAA